jgi:hypothetical protein
MPQIAAFQILICEAGMVVVGKQLVLVLLVAKVTVQGRSWAINCGIIRSFCVINQLVIFPIFLVPNSAGLCKAHNLQTGRVQVCVSMHCMGIG